MMLVDIDWEGRFLAVPLSQLRGVDVDDGTDQLSAIGTWVERGYVL
jgi:hypothetical protein